MIWDIQDPVSRFFSIPDPGVKKAPDHRFRIRNTENTPNFSVLLFQTPEAGDSAE
jgi:hypothetical protein